MTVAQQKLAAQIPMFIQVLQQRPSALPNLHIGVVWSDTGAPGDQTTALGCTAAGDNGQFHDQVGAGATTCNATTLDLGATFLSDVGGQTSFTDPIASVLVSNCEENGKTPPCWTFALSPACPAGGLIFNLPRLLTPP